MRISYFESDKFHNTIETLGECTIPTPHILNHYTDDEGKELFITSLNKVKKYIEEGKEPPSFEKAGPREKIFFNSGSVKAAIVTCGGLCPGINDVIRSIVMSLHYHYNVKNIIGFRYGYTGLVEDGTYPPLHLSPEKVTSIHNLGGSLLGTSRGTPGAEKIVDQLEKHGVNVFFPIGGDGTLKGAQAIAEECKRRGNSISVIGIPKTIDNDIAYVARTFGYNTAVEEARKAIASVHNEVESHPAGVGVVKLMGRDSGYIAACSCLSNSSANYCLIPEIDFDLYGNNGLLEDLRRRIERRNHAVIVVAEGAGQKFFKDKPVKKDASGNTIHKDIGRYLCEKIKDFSDQKDLSFNIKYIDPGYMIRSQQANAEDSGFCLALGQYAVHAAMAGKTNMIISTWNNRFIHVPIGLAVSTRKKVNTGGDLWQLVKTSTGQSELINR